MTTPPWKDGDGSRGQGVRLPRLSHRWKPELDAGALFLLMKAMRAEGVSRLGPGETFAAVDGRICMQSMGFTLCVREPKPEIHAGT